MTKEQLKMLRRVKGMSQREFAEKLGVSHVSIHLAEKGKIGLPQLFVQRVYMVFGITDEYYLDKLIEQENK